MPITKLLSLVDKLSEKTKSNITRWQETSSEKSFTTTVGDFQVGIRCQNLFIDNDIILEVKNKGNIIVDSLQEKDGLTLEQYTNLKELYKTARSSALHSEQTIDTLLTDLDSLGDI